MTVLSALGLGRGDVVAVAGAGGKTTLVYRIAAEARAAGLSVLVSTTTHMGVMPAEVTGPLVADEGDDDLPRRVREALAVEGRATLLGREAGGGKWRGVAPGTLDALRGAADLLVVEADGARTRSFKLPAAHEPVIPSSATVVLLVVGLDVLGQPLDDGMVHRVEEVVRHTGRTRGERVDEDTVVAALLAPDGYLGRLPRGARAGVFLNKVEDAGGRAAAERIVSRLVPPYAFACAGSARGEVRCTRP